MLSSSPSFATGHPAPPGSLRRAESEQALNQRKAALKDYSEAIRFHPGDWFIYMRRARLHNAMRACRSAIADLEQILILRADWSEPYALGASILAGCPDSNLRDPKKAIARAERAISLDKNRPTLLTILALAYASDGQLDKAVAAGSGHVAGNPAAIGQQARLAKRSAVESRAMSATATPRSLDLRIQQAVHEGKCLRIAMALAGQMALHSRECDIAAGAAERSICTKP